MSDLTIMTFLGLAGLLGFALQQKMKAEKRLKRQPIRIRVEQENKKN